MCVADARGQERGQGHGSGGKGRGEARGMGGAVLAAAVTGMHGKAAMGTSSLRWGLNANRRGREGRWG